MIRLDHRPLDATGIFGAPENLKTLCWLASVKCVRGSREDTAEASVRRYDFARLLIECAAGLLAKREVSHDIARSDPGLFGEADALRVSADGRLGIERTASEQQRQPESPHRSPG